MRFSFNPCIITVTFSTLSFSDLRFIDSGYLEIATPRTINFIPVFSAHLSEHKVLKVYYYDQSMSVVRRPSCGVNNFL